MAANESEGKAFEKQVLAVARSLWPTSSIASSITLEGRERDGVFITEECVHLLEITTERSLSKAREDMKKLNRLAETYRRSHPDRGVKGWFITKDEPTGEQQAEALQYKGLITSMSFSQFQTKLIDVRQYLQCRDNYRFGSSDETLQTALASNRVYIDLELSTLDRSRSVALKDMVQSLQSGGRSLILGDYGSGKSTTLLEIYKNLRAAYHRSATLRFPVFINLRDHNGAEDAADIFHRHAKKIGFANADHLVRAWRSGYCILLIDGFDEITSVGFQGKWKLLRQSRQLALAAVRDLISNQPHDSGIVVTGRAHYFDSDIERTEALGAINFSEYALNDFTDDQVKKYFESCGLSSGIPNWFPRRPYLVATLARRGVLLGGKAEELEHDPGPGWHQILNALSSREAKIDPKLDGPTVRRVLERVASHVRATENGLGPISPSDLVMIFREVCGYEPDEQGQQLLVRLPGLGIFRAGEESRIFIDEDFADACRAGDTTTFALAPWSITPWKTPPIRSMGSVGLAVFDTTLPQNAPTGVLGEAVIRAPGAVALDIVRLGLRRGQSITPPSVIREVQCDLLMLENEGSLQSDLVLQDCYFQKIQLDDFPEGPGSVRLQSCYVNELYGPISASDLPPNVLDQDCVIERWGNEVTSNASAFQALRDTRLAVLVTMLRKLFFQSGGGRKEDAFFRGLNTDEQRYVPALIKLLERKGFISTYKRRGANVWQPNRSQVNRVSAIIRSPSVCDDDLVKAALEI